MRSVFETLLVVSMRINLVLMLLRGHVGCDT